MKHLNLPKVIVVALSLTITVLPVRAAEVEGTKFSETHIADGKILQLSGTGLLRYWGFEAYTGALYLEKGVLVDEVLSDRAKRIELEYYRAIKGEDFGPATDKFIAKNLDAVTCERLRPRIEFHNSLYEDVQPGDRYSLTYVPGRGTELALNGEPKGIIAGAEFAAAVFSIWLGPKPINNAFKARILGL
jgi:hypothetical protein